MTSKNTKAKRQASKGPKKAKGKRYPKKSKKLFVVAVTGRALFDLDAADKIYQKQGLQAYLKHMRQNESKVLQPGPAYHLVKALNAITSPQTGENLVSINLISQNHGLSGMRLLHSVVEHGLAIDRVCFTGGESQVPYLAALETDLFLSFSESDVVSALKQGIPAGLFLRKWQPSEDTANVRIAFDGDSVIFDNKSEAVYQKEGFAAFLAHERKRVQTPMSEGPLKRVLECVCAIQKHFPPNEAPIRTALVTSRGAEVLLRPLMTLRSWGLEVDEALALDGYSKAGALKAFKPHIFFDDHVGHCEDASEVATSVHIPDELRKS